MPIPKDTNVGIKPVKDTGVVQVIHTNQVDHDVLRDATQMPATHPETDLVVLPEGKWVKVRERMVIDGKFERLTIVRFRCHRGRRTVRVQYHTIAGGHVMGRNPR